MKIPLSWLSEFLGPLNVKEAAVQLTNLGIEVENVEEASLPFSGVVVGRVVSATKHPNAERLQVAIVTDGTEEFQVVCGAQNCRAGLKVAFAKIGASLKDDEGKNWKIKKGKLRDVESFGMLCSPKELGLGGEAQGILELPEHLKVGTDLATLYAEPILDLSLTPNLGHCLSILGIARELAAAMQTKAKRPTFTLQEQFPFPFEIVVEDTEKCLRYASRMIKGVQVGPSPEWLQKRLTACGMRPINNVVDVANFVMLELGQPLHAFDADKIEGKKVFVSSSRRFETLLTLDGKTRQIPDHTLLICDSHQPLAIAGIMGGLDSAATEKTTTILLEAALFHPVAIRKTSKLLDLKSDSSVRFERGIDPNGIIFALDRACSLIEHIAGGTISELYDFKKAPFAPKKIPLRLARVNTLLGARLALSEISSILERLEMEVTASHDTLHVSPPTYRNDLSTEVDLIEEVARVFGYHHLPRQTPHFSSSTIPDAPIYLFENEVREALLQHGLQECVTCDLISPQLAHLTVEKGLGEQALISVLHPRSLDQSILRTSLLPGLLQTAQHNFRHQVQDLALYEVGRIHFKIGEEFKEQSSAAILLSGKNRPHHFDRKPQNVDFFDMKGVIENLLEALRCPKPVFEPSHLHTLHPGRQAQVKIGKEIVGVLGEVHPLLAQKLDLSEPLFFAELNLHELFPIKKREKKLSPLPSFPGSERDWTLTLKEDVPLSSVFHSIDSFKSPLLETFFLLDLYKSDKIGKDRKNITFRFVYRDLEKTIEVETVDKEHARLIERVAEKLRDALVY